MIKDFYTITLPDGTRSDAFERAFGDVEGLAAGTLRALMAGTWPIAGEHRAALATWIALQHLRSEDVRTSQGAMNAEMIRLLVGVSGKEALRQVIEKAEGRPVPDEELDWEWQDITKPGGPDLAPNVPQHLRTLMSLLGPTSNYLHDCHWTLFRFSRRVLVTSDHPVSLVTGRNYPAWQGIGVFTAEVFLVPLSRRLALTIQPRRRLPADMESAADFPIPGSTKLARSINQETIGNARRYVYHHPRIHLSMGSSSPILNLRSHRCRTATTSSSRRDCSMGSPMRSSRLSLGLQARTRRRGCRSTTFHGRFQDARLRVIRHPRSRPPTRSD